jgi:hypothetical protein
MTRLWAEVQGSIAGDSKDIIFVSTAFGPATSGAIRTVPFYGA